MTPERYQQIDQIFHAAIVLDPEKRAAYLDEACSGDEILRSEVESLITSDCSGLSFIDEPAFEMAARLLASDEPALAAGDRLDRYEIVSLLGVGGMGEVYLAHDERLDRKIALKLLPADLTTNHERLRRFQQEARATSALNHPNIITIHEIGQVDDRRFIATEFVDGETLRQRLKSGPLSLVESLDIAIQVCSALAAAHKAGIVHRDIKPENIMLRSDGYAKVLDFGLAKLAQEEPPTGRAVADKAGVSSGLLMGTLKYMSPEQAQRQQVDPRSDIFSLGVVLYEMVTGSAPFKGEDTSQLVRSILKDEPRLTEYAPAVPEDLQRIVSKALIKSKVKRYQAAEDLLVDLRKLKQQVERSSESQPEARRADGGTVATQDVGRATSILQSFVSQIRTHKRVATVGLLSLVILLIGVGYSLRNWTSKRATLPFQERDWVLITSFDNRTGETLFDGTIESALERELSNSQFVNVVTPERAADSLRLMKKPPETKIDAALGREICLRDGAVRALLAGRVEKLGTNYVMSVSLVDPYRNQTVASASEEAADQGNIWAAIRRLSNWVRENLGEALPRIKQSGEALEKVTTPSLRALQLYTKAMPLVNDAKWGTAEQILKQALTEDPEFASAHNMLAHMLRNQRKTEEEWGPPSQRALDLSGRTSERERYFIEGSYHSARQQYEKAVPAYEALVRQYPDYFWGRNNLSLVYFYMGRWQEYITQYSQAAELRPNDLRMNRQSAWNLLRRDMNEARRVVERVSKVITPETAAAHPSEVAWIQLFGVHDLWVRGDIEAAFNELDRWAQTIDSREGSERAAFVKNIGSYYLAFGKLNSAEKIFQRLPENDERDFFLSQVAFAAGDRAKFRDYLTKLKLRPGLGIAILLAREGLPEEAQNLLSERMKTDAFKTAASQIIMRITEGEIALSRGRTTEAISLLQEAVPAVRWNSSSLFFLASESLAAALERQADLQQSVQVLERASQQKAIAYEHAGSTGYCWLRVQWRLAQLYRKLGRVEDAQKLEAELLKTLAYADENHPILLQLKQAERQAITSR